MATASLTTASFTHLHMPPFPGRLQRKSWVHQLSLWAVFVTIASSGFVFSEPAPVDALTMGLIVLLPTIGLVAINPALVAYFSVWAVAGAGALLAATFSLDLGETVIHVGVTLYLYLASFVLAAFVAKRPAAHTELIFKAWTCAALIAGAAAFVGYFGLLPGAYDLFTKYERASGTFKDPNVLGPFLVPPLLYMLHLALQRPWRRMLVPLGVAAFLSFIILISFSRGAWMNVAVAFAIYGYLTLLTSPRASTRLKLIALLAAAAILAAGVVSLALTSDTISTLFTERASLTQSYDTGTEGRFGGQEKAIELIVVNPLGIGAKEFGLRHHSEEVHNVYLSMLLNAGWIGGGAYWILVGLTLLLGLRHTFKASELRPLFLIAYAAFVANAFEGAIVDTDHWRHFYVLMAIIWGMMSARRIKEPGLPKRAAALRRPARPARARPVRPAVVATITTAAPRRLPRMLPRILRARTS